MCLYPQELNGDASVKGTDTDSPECEATVDHSDDSTYTGDLSPYVARSPKHDMQPPVSDGNDEEVSKVLLTVIPLCVANQYKYLMNDE